MDGEYTDGGELKVDELTFRTWHTPGHTLGSWCLLCGNLFFTGDTLFHGSIGRTDFAESDPEKMKASLEKLKGAAPGRRRSGSSWPHGCFHYG